MLVSVKTVQSLRRVIWQYLHYLSIKILKAGAPAWLSWLSICFQLRSQDLSHSAHDPRVPGSQDQAPHSAPCSAGVCFSLCPSTHLCAHALTLSQIKKKKFFLRSNGKHFIQQLCRETHLCRQKMEVEGIHSRN